MKAELEFVDSVVALRNTQDAAPDRRSLSLLAICSLLLDLDPVDRTAALQALVDCCQLRVRRVRRVHQRLHS